MGKPQKYKNGLEETILKTGIFSKESMLQF